MNKDKIKIISIFKERNAFSYELTDEKRFVGISEYIAVIKDNNGAIKLYPCNFCYWDEYENEDELFETIKDNKFVETLRLKDFENYIENQFEEREDDIRGAFEAMVEVIAKTDLYIDDDLRNYLEEIRNLINEILK